MTKSRASTAWQAAMALVTLLAVVPLSAQQAGEELSAKRAEPEIVSAAGEVPPLAPPLRLQILSAVRPPELHPGVLEADVRQRNDAMLNGALIALGALGIVDNVVNHWILELHRAVPGPYTLQVEIGLVAVSTALLVTGLRRERQARRR